METADIIIVGSGMSGLYSAYKIMQYSPKTSFLILEKYKKQWIGGRASNETFYGTQIVTGAGIGRKRKDKLLYDLLCDFGFDPYEYRVNPQKILKNEVEILPILERLRREYPKYKDEELTFKQFATRVLDAPLYNAFIESAGYTDYENEDAFETLYYYGLEDNACCWKAFAVPWRELVMRMYEHIGASRFRFSNKATRIEDIEDGRMVISTEKGKGYICKKVIIATTIQGIRQLLPSKPIYNDIEGQPFLRLYAKFDKHSAEILREKIKGFTYVAKPLQRIIPMDADKGVYMIAYNDNKNTLALAHHLENNEQNREFYARITERSLHIPENSLRVLAIKDYYWAIGTHYYKPLKKRLYKDRDEFVDKAQHPKDGILVVGEVVSRNQGWTEGALESVKAVLTKKWLKL